MDMHDEIIKEKWVTSGPLFETSILSLIPRKKAKENISSEDIKECVDGIFKKVGSLKNIRIISDSQLIQNEILELSNSELEYMDIKTITTIDHERKGRLMIVPLKRNLIHINFMVIDDDTIEKEKYRQFLNEALVLFNGIVGSTSWETDCAYLFDSDRLMDSLACGIESVVWRGIQ
jgi:hypothetical protein